MLKVIIKLKVFSKAQNVADTMAEAMRGFNFEEINAIRLIPILNFLNLLKSSSSYF